MAYVLSLRPQSPLKRSFSDNPYLQSCSPLKEPFLGDITTRNTSACSLYTLGSNRSKIWNRGNENTPPLTSHSLLNLVPEKQDSDPGAQHVEHRPRKHRCGVNQALPSLSYNATSSKPLSGQSRELQHSTESSSSSKSSANDTDVDKHKNAAGSELFDLYEAIHIPLPEGRFSDNSGHEQQKSQYSEPIRRDIEPQPFRRWMSTLRRRHLQRDKKLGISFDGADEVLAVRSPISMAKNSMRRTSESITSSIGFVTAVKTTSITIASTSLAPASDRGAHIKVRLGNRSSNTDARRSIESYRGGLGPVIDESSWLRSLQRRKVVEELIASEESYIADLKVLINVSNPSSSVASTTNIVNRITS